MGVSFSLRFLIGIKVSTVYILVVMIASDIYYQHTTSHQGLS